MKMKTLHINKAEKTAIFVISDIEPGTLKHKQKGGTFKSHAKIYGEQGAINYLIKIHKPDAVVIIDE